jgi:ribonuclease HI
VRRLGWDMHLSNYRTSSEKTTVRLRAHMHLFSLPHLGTVPTSDLCSSVCVTHLQYADTYLAHDHWSGWDIDGDPQHVDIFTDGSYHQESATSAWSVVVGDQWLLDSYANIPADELLLQPGDVGGSTMFGAHILCTSGVYAAELQAIARALAMLPLSFHIHVHSDSKASIAAISSFCAETNERQRLRMSARPLLQLISSLLARRQLAGGTCQFSHVAAHTKKTDLVSVGNRLADYQANLARKKAPRTYPPTLRALPLSACEPHLHISRDPLHQGPHASGANGLLLIDDIRRTAKSDQRLTAMSKWKKHPDQGLFAGEGMVELGRVVLHFGTAAQQIMPAPRNGFETAIG